MKTQQFENGWLERFSAGTRLWLSIVMRVIGVALAIAAAFVYGFAEWLSPDET